MQNRQQSGNGAADRLGAELFVGDLYGEWDMSPDGDGEGRDPKRKRRPLAAFAPGLALCAALGITATWLGEHYAMPTMLLGLLLGLALNFSAVDPRTHAGLDFAASHGLRVGIVLIGLQVTLHQIAAIGAVPFAALVAVMLAAFAGGMLGALASGQSRYAGILAGGATAICGASAALALYSVIGRERLAQAQFALTLVGIALVSALAMTAYPAIAGQLGLDDRAAGFLIGGAIHDVAQAIGGGYSYSDAAGAEATIVKLARVALLAPVVLCVSLWIGGEQKQGRPRLARLVPPWFITAFLLVVAVNSLGIVPAWLATRADSLAKALLLLAVTAAALRSRTDLILELGWRAVVPVLAATLASFLAALSFAVFVLS